MLDLRFKKLGTVDERIVCREGPSIVQQSVQPVSK